MASLPGDPRADLFVKLHPQDVKGLIDKGYLRMNLLDFILHLTCTFTNDTSDINYCLGGTITNKWLKCILMCIRGVKKQEKFEKLCQQLEGFDKGRHQIIVPDIDKSHNSVIDIIIDSKSPNYITKVLYYDSLVQPKTRSLTKKNVQVEIKKFIHNLLEFSTCLF